MDDNMMKDNLESNSKRSSLAEAVIVKWTWNDDRKRRIFNGLRLGGTAETEHDLEMKYPEESFDQESVLVHAEQFKHVSIEEKKARLHNLLNSEDWLWDTTESEDFAEKISELY